MSLPAANSEDMIQKIAFSFYNLICRYALPGLRFHHRLTDGYEQQTLKSGMSPANLWIQAATTGESNLALAIIQSLRPANTARVLLTSKTRQGVDIPTRALMQKKKISGRLQI
jgi:3-deoxy-D-manno-octulosonic-acid transferase